MKVLFLHGWHSVPGGVKPNYLAEHDLEVLNPPLDDDDFGEAVAAAQAEFDKHRPQVVVGSSRGGAVAMNIKSGDAWLVLLCPAWRNWGTRRTVKADTVILHSRADDVIPFADSEELVRNSGLPAWTLVEVGNDHRLADPESLAMMLDACRIKDEEADEEEDLLERDWTGLCYTAALRWADEEEHRDWVVVHGTVLSEKLGKASNTLGARAASSSSISPCRSVHESSNASSTIECSGQTCAACTLPTRPCFSRRNTSTMVRGTKESLRIRRPLADQLCIPALAAKSAVGVRADFINRFIDSRTTARLIRNEKRKKGHRAGSRPARAMGAGSTGSASHEIGR